MTGARPPAPGDDEQPPCVLVAYATTHGATAGIAERIAHRLEERGSDVEVRPLVAAHDLTGYDAVVFGSPVYDGCWLPEADAFVAEQRDALVARPTWVFSVGSFGDRGRMLGRFVTREPKGVRTVLRDIGAREYRVFAGVAERGRRPLPSRIVYRLLGGRMGDNRDWPLIDAWAAEIASALDGDAAASSRGD